MKWTVAIVVGVLAVVIVGGGAAYWFLHRPLPQLSYYGVAFTDGKAEVQYKLGTPPHVTAPEISGEWKGFSRIYDVDGDASTDKNLLPSSVDFHTFDNWAYNSPNDAKGYLSVTFRKSNGRVNGVACISDSQAPNSCAPVLGLHAGDTEARVRSLLGPPTYERLDGPSKMLLYQPLNVSLTFQREKLYIIAVGLYQKTQPR